MVPKVASGAPRGLPGAPRGVFSRFLNFRKFLKSFRTLKNEAVAWTRATFSKINDFHKMLHFANRNLKNY